jgi:hypothetical protein
MVVINQSYKFGYFIYYYVSFFFFFNTCQRSTLFCIYICTLLDEEKVEISFVFVFLYVNLFFSKHTSFFFFLFFFIHYYLLLHSRVIKFIDQLMRKNSISYASPCSFALGSVNYRVLLMMKLIFYRYFLLLSAYRHLHHRYSLLIITYVYVC